MHLIKKYKEEYENTYQSRAFDCRNPSFLFLLCRRVVKIPRTSRSPPRCHSIYQPELMTRHDCKALFSKYSLRKFANEDINFFFYNYYIINIVCTYMLYTESQFLSISLSHTLCPFFFGVRSLLGACIIGLC